MNIRKARPEDANSIFHIARENAVALIPSTELEGKGFLVSNYTKDQYESYITQCEHFYVLEEEQGIQGFLLAFTKSELDESQIVNQQILTHAKAPFVVIKQICIASSAQKKGYGGKLYQFFMNTIEEDIFLSVVLEPYNEPSMKFHDKLGFTQELTVTAEDKLKRAVFYWKNTNK